MHATAGDTPREIKVSFPHPVWRLAHPLAPRLRRNSQT